MRDFDFVVLAGAVVFADGVHDGRIFERTAGRGRLLRVGAVRVGNFWGFQEAWLSLAASIFDMAIYPTLFVFDPKQYRVV